MMFSLDLGYAAIDIKPDSGHVTRFVRCEKGNSLGYLVGISQSAQRNVFCEFLLHLCQRFTLLPGVEDRSIDMPPADVVDPDPALLPILGPPPRQRPYSRLPSSLNTH